MASCGDGHDGGTDRARAVSAGHAQRWAAGVFRSRGRFRSRALQWARVVARLPWWVSVLGLGLVLAGLVVLVDAAGGAKSALPHLFYLPILLAAVPFERWGAPVTAVLAALLCGVFVPLDTLTGEHQSATAFLI